MVDNGTFVPPRSIPSPSPSLPPSHEDFEVGKGTVDPLRGAGGFRGSPFVLGWA